MGAAVFGHTQFIAHGRAIYHLGGRRRWRDTLKCRGRPISIHARGETTANHGPFQRLSGA
jgi:hypothetical protein